ncbi:MAG: hypothetical protein K8L97_12460 [Anaerolineae bacterium]|nr:hypothetical protein [Anaerolineae bacterium]
MKFLRRSIMVFALLVGVICVVLLINFTAPNPTGRRYSSETPLTTGDAQGWEIGRDGERVLSKDLHLLTNNDPAQTQCICSTGSNRRPNQCKVCIAELASLANFRVPDFVAPDFMAESKNEQGLLYYGREISQISDYALAAHLTGRHLWIYVRVDTEVADEFIRLVESTGGDVVYYFTTPGYVDPVDQTAQAGLAGAGLAFGLIGWRELRSRGSQRQPKLISPIPKPTAPPKSPNDPLNRTTHKIDAAVDFVRRAKDRQRRDIDKDSSYEELRNP